MATNPNSPNTKGGTPKANWIQRSIDGFVSFFTKPAYAVPFFLLVAFTLVGEVVSTAEWAKEVEAAVRNVALSLAMIGAYLFLVVYLIRLAIVCWVPEQAGYFITGMIVFTLLLVTVLFGVFFYVTDMAVSWDSVLQAWHARGA